jgi:hypothetical protein
MTQQNNHEKECAQASHEKCQELHTLKGCPAWRPCICPPKEKWCNPSTTEAEFPHANDCSCHTPPINKRESAKVVRGRTRGGVGDKIEP